jgi:4-hydroxybenzoate polyprenyltransferase
MLTPIITILRMIRFSHTVFALPFAVLAAFLAGNDGIGGFCGWEKLILVVLCMVFARSAAMTFNRIADAQFDRRNPRTADRAIPAGQITKTNAWLFFAACAVLFIATTALFYFPIAGAFGFENPWPLIFSIPVLIFICSYSYTKRFTWASHFWLGASLLLAPVGAWAAVSPPVGPVTSLPVWLLGGAVLLWTAGFDIIYACQDIEVDRREGLYSIPAKLGGPQALWISRTCHSIAITLLLLVAVYAQLGKVYLTAVIITALLLAVEHYLVRQARMTRIKLAFATINGTISILLTAAAITDILTR